MYSIKQLATYLATRKQFILLVIVLLLVACGKPEMSITPIANTAELINVLTPTVELTPLPLQSSTPTPNPKIIQLCLDVENKETLIQSIAMGTIIIDGSVIEPVSMTNLQTGVEYKIPFSNSETMLFWGGNVSLDRNKLAFTGGIQNKAGEIVGLTLWVINAQGDTLAKVTFDHSNLSNMRWFDDEHLLFYFDQTSKDGTVITLNPFTREQKFVSNQLPNLYYDSSLRLDWQVEYGSNLDWVVYFAKIEESVFGPIVYDLVTKQILWQPSYGHSYEKPVWSPNGEKVAVIGNGQLYIVNRSGQVTPVLDKSSQNQATKPSWSPDGQHIAFWNAYNLMVYDDEMGQVIDYCIKNEYPDIPLWSPNSQQFVIQASLGSGGKLIDIQENIAYNLQDMPGTVYPVDWMNSLP